MTPNQHTPFCFLQISLVFVAMLMNTTVMAAPKGGNVVAGEGEISQSSNRLTEVNQHSQNLAIDWQSFNLESNETINFVQPNQSSVVLNRIQDVSASQIFGQINANGQVFLSNPNGVVFGKSAQVNVGGLLATSLLVDPHEFMQGRFELTASQQKGLVVNQGLIQAASGGGVTLIGAVVKNEGLIVANKGEINLAAADKAIVDFTGDGLLNFEIQSEVSENNSNESSAISNSGQLISDGGKILMNARVAQDVFTNAVNNTGIVRATRIEKVGGVVRLLGTGSSVRNSGEISAKQSGRVLIESSHTAENTNNGSIDVSNENGKGGNITVLAKNIGILDNAGLNADGTTGGGDIRIGGDIQGAGDLPHADFTVLTENASISADATQHGDGGSIVLWSDKSTYVDGAISARGGSESGNGGFVETSGKQQLFVTKGVDASASNGNAGEWLMDPVDITISNDTTTINDPKKVTDPYIYQSRDQSTAIVSANEIEAALESGTSVIVTTVLTDGTTVQDPVPLGNINVEEDIIVSGSDTTVATLTLRADNDIIFAADKKIEANTQTLNVAFEAKHNVDLSSAATIAVKTNGGSFSSTDSATNTDAIFTSFGKTIDTSSTNGIGGNISITSDQVTLGRLITDGGVSINGETGAAAGSITIESITNNISLNDNLSAIGGIGNTDVGNGGQVDLVSSTLVNGDVEISTGDSNGDITFQSTLAGVDDTVDKLTLVAGTGAATADSTINTLQGLTISSADSVTLKDTVIAASDGVNITAGTVNLQNTLTTSSSGLVSITNANTLTVDGKITADGGFTQNGNGTVALNADIETSADTIQFSKGVNVVGPVTLNSAGGEVSFGDTITGDGANGLTILSGVGKTTFSGAVSNVKDINVTAGLVDINNTVNTVNAGKVSIDNSDTLSINNTITADGGFAQIGSGAVTLNGTIETSNDNINFAKAVTLSGGTSSLTSNGGNITFSDALNGSDITTDTLNLTAGVGSINFNNTVGNIKGLKINSANTVTAQNTLATGTDGINITANTIDLQNTTTTSQGGMVIINNANAFTIGNKITTDGGLQQIGAGAVNLNADVESNSGVIEFAKVVTVNNGTRNLISNGGDITFNDAIVGGDVNADALELSAGVGTININNTVSNLKGLKVNSANSLITKNSVAADAGGINITAGAVDLQNTVTTTNSGLVTINNSDVLTIGGKVTADGGFTQSGAGSVALKADIDTTGDSIQFAKGVDVTEIRTLNSTGGDITFSETITGTTTASDLIVQAGNGKATLAGAVTDINDLTVTAGVVDINNTLNTVNAGKVTINNSDRLSINNTITADGGFTQNGAGIVTLNGNIITTADPIEFAKAVTVTGDRTLSSNNGDITFNDVLTGSDISTDKLNFTAGAGTITLNNSVSGLKGLKVNSANIVTAKNTLAAGVDGIDISASTIDLQNTVNTGNNGIVLLNNTNAITIGSKITADGGFKQTGAGSVNLNADIESNGGVIEFAKAVTSSGIRNINSNGGKISFAEALVGTNNTVDTFGLTAVAGDIVFDSSASNLKGLTVLSANQLTTKDSINVAADGINITAGLIDLQNTITTTDSGLVTINNSDTLTIGGKITADGGFIQSGNGSVALNANIETTNDNIQFSKGLNVTGPVTLTSAGGEVSFNDTVTGDGVNDLTILSGVGKTTFSSAVSNVKNINVTAGLVDINNSVSTVSAGKVTIDNNDTLSINDTITADGGFAQIGAGAVTLNGTIETTNDNIEFSKGITITGGTRSLTSNGGDITFNDVIVGGDIAVDSLDLTASAGTININNEVSNLKGLKVNSANSLITKNSVVADAGGIDITAGTVDLQNTVITTNSGLVTIANANTLSIDGKITADGGFTQNGSGTTALNANIETTSDNIQFSKGVNVTGPVTLTSTGGEVSFNDSVTGDGVNDLTILSGVGKTTFSGAVSNVKNIDITAGLVDINGGVTTINAGKVTINNSDTLSVNNAITADGGFAQIGSGAVTLNGTIETTNDDINFAKAVTLSGGTSSLTSNGGNITFNETLNGGDITTDALNLTAGAGSINFNNTVGNVRGLKINSANTVTAQNTLAAGADGINITANTIDLQNTTTTSQGGIVTINNANAFTIGNQITADGGFQQTGAGAVNLNADIDSNNGVIEFAKAVTVNDGTRNLTSNGGNITFNDVIAGGDINLDALELAAGAGTINLNNTVSNLKGLKVNSANSLITKNSLAADADGIDITAGTVDFQNTVTTTNSGLVTIANANTLSIGGKITADGGFSQTGNGSVALNADIDTTNDSIQFAKTVDVSGERILNSTGGDITFSDAINGISVNQLDKLDLQAGTGTVTLMGPVNNLHDLNVTAGLANINNTLTTVNAGKVTFNNSDTLSINNQITADGGFSQTGTGAVTLNANITTTGDIIEFAKQVTVTGGTRSLTSNGGDITFSDAIAGGDINSDALELTADAGSINVNSVSNLKGIKVNSANVFTSTNPLSIGSDGIELTANTIVLQNSISTSDGGSVTLNNTNSLTIGGDIVVDGEFAQIGSGISTLAGSIQTNAQQIRFDGAVLVSGSQTLDTGEIAGDVIFINTIDAKNVAVDSLTINAGSGSMNASSKIGSTALAGLTINAQQIDLAEVTADAAGIQLSGANIDLNKELNTVNGGAITITHSETLNIHENITSTGDVVQNGLGQTNLFADINSNGSGIQFAGPILLHDARALISSGGNITLNNSVDAAVDSLDSLNLIAGNGDVIINAAIGEQSQLSQLIIESAKNVDLNGVRSKRLEQISGSGLTTLNGTIETDLTDGVSINTYSVTLNGMINTKNSGVVTINHSDLFTLNGSINTTNSFSQIGLGSNVLSGEIHSNQNDIIFNSPIRVSGNALLDTGTGVGDIQLNNTVEGATSGQGNLVLNAGEGNMLFAQTIGRNTRLGNLTIKDAANLETNDIRASSIQLDNATNVLFDGVLDTDSVSGIHLNANEITLKERLATSNGGSVTINNTGKLNIGVNADMDLDGEFAQSGIGEVTLASDIKTTGKDIVFNELVQLSADSSLSTGIDIGNISLNKGIIGPYLVGLSTGMGDLNIDSVDVKGFSVLQANALKLNNDWKIENDLLFNNVNDIELTNNVSLDVGVNQITFVDANSVYGNHNLQINAGEVELFSIGTTDNPLSQLTVNATQLGLNRNVYVNGSIDLLNPQKIFIRSGLALNASGENAQISLSTIDAGSQSVNVNNDGLTQLAGNITGDDIDFTNANGGVLLLNDISIDTSFENGDIFLDNISIQGEGKSLTLAAGRGDVAINHIGAKDAALRNLSILSADRLELNGELYTENGFDFSAPREINLRSNLVVLDSSAGDGQIDLSQNELNGNSNLIINSGSGDIKLSGLGSLVEIGDLELHSSGTTFLNDAIFASQIDLSQLTGNIQLLSAVEMNTARRGGNIDFSNANVIGDFVFTVNSGGGDVSAGWLGNDDKALGGFIIDNAGNLALNNDIHVLGGLDFSNSNGINVINDSSWNTSDDNGNINLGNASLNGDVVLTVDSGAGDINLALVGNVLALKGVNLNSNNLISLNGDILVDGNFFVNPLAQINLSSDTLINTSTANGNVNMASVSIDGNKTLEINTGSGDVATGIIGDKTPLTSLHITGNNILTQSVTTHSDQQFNGEVEVRGRLATLTDGEILLNGNLQLSNGAELSAMNTVQINGDISSSEKLSLISSTGAVNVNGIIGSSESKVDTVSISGNGVLTSSIHSANGINIHSDKGVEQTGDYLVDSGEIVINALGGDILQANATKAVASDDIQYQASGNVQFTELRSESGNVLIVSEQGSIRASHSENENILASSIELTANSGISAVDVNNNATALKLTSSQLSFQNNDSVVILETKNANQNPLRPEENPLIVTQAKSSGDLTHTHTGSISYQNGIDANSGAIQLVSSSRMEIGGESTANDNVTITIGENTPDTGADDLILSGNLTSKSGSVSIDVNDNVELLGGITGTQGDVSVVSNFGAISLTHINAGANKATVMAKEGAIESASQQQTNIIANSTELVAGTGNVGSFDKPILLNTNATLLSTSNAFVTGNVGVVINNSGDFVDPGVADSSANKGQSVSAQEFSFIDVSLFSQDFSTVNVIGSGIKLPEDQIEELDELQGN